MDEQLHRTVALANRTVYDEGWTLVFVEGAPQVKHASLKKLYAGLMAEAINVAAKYSNPPRVLNLGAGEGSATLPLLELGAHVTAIDISNSQLDALRKKCERFGQQLEVRCADVGDALRTIDGPFDIVTASAFLHHVPDYLGLIRDAIPLVAPYGQFLSFQDPLRYDSLGRFTKAFDELSYLSWRIFQGDLWGGLQRRIRRSRGKLSDDCALDNAEYHILRNGVDQDAIVALLRGAGFQCEVVRYFSTQSRLFQPLGTALGVKNTFAIVARKGIN